MKDIYIAGAGIVAEMLIEMQADFNIRIVGIFDDFCNDKSFHCIPLKGKIQDIYNNTRLYSSDSFFIAVGNDKGRADVSMKLIHNNINIINLIHSKAVIEKSASMGTGNLFYASIYIGVKTIIGNGNYFFPGSCITHHNKIGNYNFFGPNASVGGFTEIGNLCHFGMNSVAAPFLKLDNLSIEPLMYIKESNLTK